MATLIRVQPDFMSEQDLHWLTRICESSYTGVTVEGLLPELVAGVLAMWKLEGDAKGLIITQILQHPAGRELNVWGLAGTGILANREEIFSGLQDYGRAQNCRWIGGRSIRPGLTKVYTQLYARAPYAALFLKEI